MQAPPINQHQTEELFQWLQTMTFSRTPKNLSRDFSDGVLMAEILHHHYPLLVQLHNYQPANSSASKYVNWKTLNQKILRKLGFQVSRPDVEGIIGCAAGAIQRVLYMVYQKVIQNQVNIQNQTISLATKLSQMSNMTNSNLNLSRSRPLNLQGTSLQQQQQKKNNFAKQLSSQLAEKQKIIQELRQTIQILETKMKKMEQLSKLKDAKIDSLMKKLDQRIGL